MHTIFLLIYRFFYCITIFFIELQNLGFRTNSLIKNKIEKPKTKRWLRSMDLETWAVEVGLNVIQAYLIN